MKCFSLLSVSLIGLLAQLCLTAPTDSIPPPLPPSFSRSTSSCQYDAIIVGGGPSGLSTLSALGRLRRTAIAFDSGQYRNLLTRRQHDILGSDGMIPAVFRQQARQQILKYPTVSIYNTTITNITRGTSCFEAVDGTHTWTSRKIILGTGLTDVLPETPGIAENWGKGIYWCPWCDGYENRDRRLGVLGDFTASLAKQGIYLQSLNRDIVLFPNCTMNSTTEQAATASMSTWQEELETLGVKIDNRLITDITRINGTATEDGYDEFRVTFEDGATTIRDAFVVNYPSKQTSTLGERMGVTIDDDGKLQVTHTMETNVEGVYAVGDINSDDSTNVPHAMWSGKRAGVDIVHQLALEDAEALVGLRNVPAVGYVPTRKRSLERVEVENRESEADLALRDLQELYERVVKENAVRP